MGSGFTGNAADIIESLTKGMKSINTDHGYIHDGLGFIGYLSIGDLAQGASESYSIICNNANKYPHMKNLFLKTQGASIKVEVFRGTTANPLTINSAGGAASEWIGGNNLNDNSTNESDIVVKKTPTYTDNEDGEVWIQASASANTTNQSIDSGDFIQNENQEFIMKPNTYYVIKITNVHGTDDASEVGLSLFWYEESEGLS